jgi:hypothetical protein
MVDIDPGLDAKLRAFFDHVEGSAPPSDLTDIDVASPQPRRRTVNLFAGLATATVVAASVVVFASELRSHDNPSPRPAVTSSPASPSASVSSLKDMPVLGSGGVPASAHFVIPVTHGQGSVQLHAFVPQGALYIQFDCAGPGAFKIVSTNRVIGNDLSQCSSAGGVTTFTVGSPKVYDGKPLTLEVAADPSMSWEIYVAQSRPLLPEFSVRADQTVLVPVTYGTGAATLPTFEVGPDEWLNVTLACNSGSAADTVDLVGPAYFGSMQQAQCSDPMGASGGFGSAAIEGAASGPISVHLKADPSISWEILITEGPAYVGWPSPADVAVVPAAYGTGSAALPNFTPTTSYAVAFACSGLGSLTIRSADFSQIAAPTCGGGYDFFEPPAEVPGRPVSLSVEAPPSVAWEITIFQGPLSSGQGCKGVWSNLPVAPSPRLGNMAPQRLGNTGICPPPSR